MQKFDFLNSRSFGPINTSSFRFWDNMVGWVVFAIATISYWLTMEPTTSLWDCSEYIATSYKLEVGHPPGAPLYMMLARIASLFASSPEDVAMMINGMNSLVSGFTILFMFWTITHLARRIVTPSGVPASLNSRILVLGSGVIGALSYAYTDTFWFSAVEGEVYAMSSMFTALVVWLMFKWEENADSPTSLRWIILIAYLMGLSIGVHILNLLTIPALVMIFFFRRYRYNPEKPWWLYPLMIIAALLVSMLILGAINGVIIPYTVALGAHFDTLMVNSFGMAPNVGMVIYVFLVFAALGTLIFTTHKHGKRILNVSLLCVTVILVGFSSYAMMTIRANANPPMNSNDPSNPHMLLSVLNRDQYGARPLLKGVYYDAYWLPMVEQKPGGGSLAKDANGNYYVDVYDATGDCEVKTTMWYNPATKKYQERITERAPIYPDEAYHYFPRMWYPGSDRSAAYKAYMDQANPNIVRYDINGDGVIDNDVDKKREGNQPEGWVEPTRGEDLRFFMSYQMGDMFWRYFMWNFVGRQDDVQLEKSAVSGGLYVHGGWLSGIDFIDEYVCGPQDKLPMDMRSNPARNTYFFLPLLLGLMGLAYQLVRDWRNWLVVMLMFVMMGVALVVYFNTAPNEPRERDYVYAGAFYAFSIWIGLGVLGIGELFESIASFIVGAKDNLRSRASAIAAAVAVIFSASVPLVLASENWDDHDRSDRYYVRDIGWNYLTTAPKNAIIINYGDNDTFPLWYCQEVEGVRPDVKVMNLSYLDAEWYIDQMKLASNAADGVPFTIPQEKYTLSDPYVYLPTPIDYIIDEDFRHEYEEYSRRNNELLAKTYLFKGKYDSVNMTMEAALNTLEEGQNIDYKNPTNEERRLMDLCGAIERNNDLWDDYDEYYENETRKWELYDSYVPLYAPSSLPLADAVAHYVSDDPMWMLVNEDGSRHRIVKMGGELPEGFTPVGTLPAKVDSPSSGEPIDYMIYAQEYTVPVDKEAVLKAGIVEEIFADKIVDEVKIRIPTDGSSISRSTMMIYDLIANSDWSRPICFTQLNLMKNNVGILDYARFDGLCYTFVPIYTPYSRSSGTIGCMDIDKLYPIFMDECKPGDLHQALRFGNLADEDVLADYFVRFNINTSNMRENFSRVANGFIDRGAESLYNAADDASLTEAEYEAKVNEAMADFAKAENLLDRGLTVLPPDKLGYDYYYVMPYVESYYTLGRVLAKYKMSDIAEKIFAKGDNLNICYMRNRAEWMAHYYNILVGDKGLNADIFNRMSSYFEDICDGLWSAYSVGSLDIAVKSAGVENIIDKYVRLLIKQLPDNIKEEVKEADEKVYREDDYFYNHMDNEEHKALMKRVLSLYSNLFDRGGNLIKEKHSLAYEESVYTLMKESGIMDKYGRSIVKNIVFAERSGAFENDDFAVKSGDGYAEQALSKEVQDIVAIYDKGMESWKRATDHLKTFVDSAASRLGVKVYVEREDDFQYFYTYSERAQQLISMANSEGVSVADIVESLQRSDEEYMLADEYLKMGDNSAMKYMAECYDAMAEALQRMEGGAYSVEDALTVDTYMREIADVLSISLSEAGSFDWVANPVDDGTLGFVPVQFDALADRFFRIAMSAVDNATTDKNVNMLLTDAAVSVYSLVPSRRSDGNSEGDAKYVDIMNKYLTHPTIYALLEQLYQ